MTPGERRAHLILQGLVLIDEWLVFCDEWDASQGSNRMLLCDPISLWREAMGGVAVRGLGYTWCGEGLLDCLLANGDYYTHPRNIGKERMP